MSHLTKLCSAAYFKSTPHYSSPNFIYMNVVPRSTGNTNSGTRELTLKCKFKCYLSATGFDSHRGQKIFSLPRVVPCFPLLGLTPSGLFMGLSST